MDAIVAYLAPHWPFAAFSVIAAVLGRWMVVNIFTKENAAKGALMMWGRRTLPLHPVFVGAALGVFWTQPESAVTFPASMLYFAISGAMSLWLFEFTTRIAKKRGIEINLTPWEDVKIETTIHKTEIVSMQPSTTNPIGIVRPEEK